LIFLRPGESFVIFPQFLVSLCDTRQGRKIKLCLKGLDVNWRDTSPYTTEVQSAGEIRKEVDVRQLAFEIQALAMGANWRSRLFRDQDAYRAARAAILQRIDQATEPMQSRE